MMVWGAAETNTDVTGLQELRDGTVNFNMSKIRA